MKLISVPLSLDAQIRLKNDDCNSSDLVEIKLTNEEFYKLFNTSFFDELNQKLGLMIDDYEDESLPYEKIPEAIAVLNLYIDKSDESFWLLEIKRLFNLAYDKKTGVYFYF